MHLIKKKEVCLWVILACRTRSHKTNSPYISFLFGELGGAMSQCRKIFILPTSVIMADAGSVIMAKKISASHNGEKRKMGEGERI